MTKIRIYLADDHAILRDGLKVLLLRHDKFEIAGEAGDGKKALEEIEKLKPDIAILDISMPGMTGLEVARQIKKYNKSIIVIILSRYDNVIHVKEALQNGADGYILKDYAVDELFRAITEVMKGEIYLSPRLTTCLILNNKHLSNNSDQNLITEKDILSKREKQILTLITESKTNKEISIHLRISEQTVKSHRKNIMKKLNLHKSTELTIYAIKNDLIDI